ncbi:MAG: hypothetical protein IKZ08_02660 [Bacteroidales bacterium]|nr:hypothetical protein [Bacteroidales bacterium]
MVLITILALIACALIALVVGGVVIGGSAFIVFFADIIVCVAIIVWIIRIIAKKRK